VPNRAAWDLRQGSAVLLRLLIQTFAPRGRLLFGLDDTIERRWGPKFPARGPISISCGIPTLSENFWTALA
jgi:hypothetical protein